MYKARLSFLEDRLPDESKVSLYRKGHTLKYLSSGPVEGQAIDGAECSCLKRDSDELKFSR
jgi:hypothetical protein